MTQQQKALAEKSMIAAARDRFQAENETLEKRLQELSKHHSLKRLMENPRAMAALMKIEGFRSLNADIFGNATSTVIAVA